MPRLALVQFASVPPTEPKGGEKNLARALGFIEDAKLRGADIVVFPEYFLSGVLENEAHRHLAQSLHDPDGDWEQRADDGHWLSALRRAARTHKIDVVAGTIVERAKDGSLQNTCFYILRDGSLAGRYVKQNLWHPEKAYITPGEHSPAPFDTPWGRVGYSSAGISRGQRLFEPSVRCQSCGQPAEMAQLLLAGVDLVVVPAHWLATDATPAGLAHCPDAEQIFLDNMIVARAYENECCVVFVNCAGPAHAGFVGRSAVSVPFKGCVARAVSKSDPNVLNLSVFQRGPEEELLFVDVDLSILQDARGVYRIREDLMQKVKRSDNDPRRSVTM